MRKTSGTYEPVNTLKPVAADVWVVDGPIIRFGPRGLRMPFPTRMTVIRLAGDALFIHSPTPLVPALAEEIGRTGRPAWIIGPSRLHYWWIPEWRSAFREARVHLAPRVREQAGGRIDFPTLPLERESDYPWDEEIATLPVAGSYMTEVVFFHHASRTLVLTDLIENFEREKLDSLLMRLLTKIGGVRDPDGRMPYDMRLTFRERKPELRAAVERMIAWGPERILLAHGRWYAQDGVGELRRAFRWLLR
ncbi:MAG TPA: DUF4336 domain-containing protein [Steroidobacteraceae bacterium]|nr:DUF4336 domain-containing protein [Steroidobacteraceae bacterium]